MSLLERVVRDRVSGTRFRDVSVLERTDSTNRVVADLARAGAPEGVVVAAEHQSAGRGRLGRRWDAPPGSALLVSVLLRPDLPAERLHLVTSAVALAAAGACRQEAGFGPAIKWPNDLLVGDRKLAGVLAEVVGEAVVVGIGLNVSAAPPGAASAEEAAGRPVDRSDLLAALLCDLDRRCGRWDEVAAAYAAACATVGRRVSVQDARGVWEGFALGVDAAGRLLVELPAAAPGPAAPAGAPARRVEALAAADVVHLRSVG